jgi:hypothetical protein
VRGLKEKTTCVTACRPNLGDLRPPHAWLGSEGKPRAKRKNAARARGKVKSPSSWETAASPLHDLISLTSSPRERRFLAYGHLVRGVVEGAAPSLKKTKMKAREPFVSLSGTFLARSWKVFFCGCGWSLVLVFGSGSLHARRADIPSPAVVCAGRCFSPHPTHFLFSFARRVVPLFKIYIFRVRESPIHQRGTRGTVTTCQWPPHLTLPSTQYVPQQQ